MEDLEDESVHLIITSPPYWQLKDYGNGSQIGFNDSYEDYINNLNLVWKECYRVLQKGCRLCVNISRLTGYSNPSIDEVVRVSKSL